MKLEKVNTQDKPQTTITYYGKKMYSITPRLAQKKRKQTEILERRYEDVTGTDPGID